MFENVLKNGIYFIQTDAREDGYYTKDSDGNLIKHKYKITVLDKLNFFIFNKSPNNPIATRFILFAFISGNAAIFSGFYSGDAISTAKDVKTRYRYLHKQNFKEIGNMIQIDFEDRFIELTFNEVGQNIKSNIRIKRTNKVVSEKNYSFLCWDNI